MKKKKAFLLLALVILVLVAFIPVMKKENAQQNEMERAAQLRQEQMEQLRPLLNEKQALQREINAMRDALSGDGKQAGEVMILYRSPSQRIPKDIFKDMQSYGAKGTILITPQAFPGQNGCMSIAELQALLNAGWDICVPYLKEDVMTKFIDIMVKCGLPAPHALFLEEVDADIVSYAAQFDFDTVIYINPSSEAVLEDVFSIQAYSHREDSTTINAVFAPLQSSKCYIAITVGFAADDADAYNSSRMDSILDYCAYYGISVVPVSEIITNSQQTTDGQENQIKIQSKLEQMNQQLKDIQQQIDDTNRQLGK